jgi:small conductance mechanosensitive channel
VTALHALLAQFSAAADPATKPAADATTDAARDQPFFLQLVNHPAVWFGIKIVGALLLAWIGVHIGRWAARLEHRVLLRAHVDQILAEFLRNVTYAVVLALIFVSALEVAGFPTTSLFAVLGAAGLAIGLALKDSLANIAAGVVLIVLRPFRVGDTVTIAGQDGVVEGVFIFQTRLHTADNRDLIFMNSAVIAAPIFNQSMRSTRRADITLVLAHGADLQAVYDVAKQAIAADDRILNEPAPAFSVGDITERGLVFGVQVWSAAAVMGDVRAKLLAHLYEQFGARGVALAHYTGPPAKA